MKTIGYVIATALTLAIAAPTLASAETVVIKRDHGDRGYGARAEMRHRDRGWHHHHDRKVVIIKRHRHH